ncbi:MAG: hypothetical protein LBS56_03125 [Propionibacteriaceae bacterium]|jgi:hypothetical protein|nr:hypothetical protein [Propionibacteriaceae bacterium]
MTAAGTAPARWAVDTSLVALAAREEGLPLATRDARAAGTYSALGVAFELVALR